MHVHCVAHVFYSNETVANRRVFVYFICPFNAVKAEVPQTFDLKVDGACCQFSPVSFFYFTAGLPNSFDFAP